jgi:pimeloyl-ACP methyl ester carboxylesterase
MAASGRHQTIGVELRGHGRTADSGRPITPAALAGDVVALLDHLNVAAAHVSATAWAGPPR